MNWIMYEQNFKIIKEGISVAIGSFVALAVAFIFYYLIFILFETMGNRDGAYDFISPVPIGCRFYELMHYNTDIGKIRA